MNREKIACVVHQYGTDVNGGAEYHCRVLAEHMLVKYSVDVFTSCSREYPWDNYYKEGQEDINGVRVNRFPVEKARSATDVRLSERIRKGDASAEDDWLEKAGPYCPKLIVYLKRHADEYKAVIFFTYTSYMTGKGLKLNLKNSILLPTAHDDPGLSLPIYRRIFRLPKAILWNSIEERELVTKQFQLESKPSRLTCVGIDMREGNGGIPKSLEEYIDNCIIYVGRISAGKGFRELNQYFIEYKKRNPSSLKMIVVGRKDEGIELKHSRDIIYAGFVSEEEKNAIMKKAKLLVMPSLYESLSLVILESMAMKRPVLVNGKCSVLKGQCIRSNAGLYYTSYFEFEAALNYILNNKEAYIQMCDNGYRFVKENYDWNTIIDNVASLIEEIQ